MSDQTTPDEAPEETETYEQFDEVAERASTGRQEDPGDAGVTGAASDLTRLTEMPVDEAENEEIGAGLDDPEQMSMIDGAMDDPDGIDPGQIRAAHHPEDDGWDLDAGDES